MKKIFSMMAVALVVFSLASCKGHNEPDQPDQPTDSTYVPTDTTVVPVDTTVVPVDTTVVSCEFTIAVSDITFSSASVKVTPSDKTVPYYWGVAEAAELEGKTEKDFIDEAIETINFYIAMYAAMGYELSMEDFLSLGEDSYTYQGLTPNTEFIVYAFGLNEEGEVTTDMTTKAFATPEVEVTGHEQLAIEGEYIDAIEDEGWYQIMGYSADSVYYLSISPDPVESLDGKITEADLDAEYSYLYVGEDVYSIVSADLEGKLNGEIFSLTGKFVAANGIEYSLTFTGTPYVEEEGDDDGGDWFAPAKRALKKAANVRKAPKHFVRK